MTEQEFRDALKKTVGSTGLSSDRQMNVLARMKGEEPKVRTWNKMKVSLVLALVVMMSMGAAVATEIIDYVNWKGEPANAPQHDWENQEEIWQRMLELSNSPDESVAVIVTRPASSMIGEITSVGDSTISERMHSLAEMADSIQENGVLPWPMHLPEKSRLSYGLVNYFCDGAGEYTIVDQIVTEDAYVVHHLTIPEEYRRTSSYQASVWLTDDRRIEIRAYSHTGDGPRGVYIGEESIAEHLKVDGMEDVLFIKSPTECRVTMRKTFDEPIGKTDVFRAEDGWGIEQYQIDVKGYSIEIVTQDMSLTAADLLAIFGLTAQ